MKTKRVLPLLAVAVMSVASAVLGASSAAADDATGRTATAAPTGPARCADIRAADPSARDGEYTLVVQSLRIPVYCHAMADDPAEYLTLPRTGGDRNFSQYTAGGASPGTTVVTHYTRIRFDPHPVSLVPLVFRVNIADQTFATSAGQLCHSGNCGETVTSMPYAVAMDCQGGAQSGRANLDLTGTLFAPEDTFLVQGSGSAGTTTYSSPQVVDVQAGGFCGWVAPAPTYNPINQNPLGDANGGWDLRLRLHLPFSLPL